MPQGPPEVRLKPMTTIEKLFTERILVLDGAMGTMIQSHNLAESDFRGERFSDHETRLEPRSRS